MTAPERRPSQPTYGQPQVLFLYQHYWNNVKTVLHHLEAFHRFSRFDVSYVSSTSRCRYLLDDFAAIVIHYTSRICHPGYISTGWYEAAKRFKGVKAVYLQDEYENVHLARKTLADLQFDFVFTCVPDSEIEKVYPKRMFPNTKFVNVLTGYVPLDIDDVPDGPPMAERTTLIGYRGRNLGYWYGDLGREKVEIGRRMKRVCKERGLPVDIGWEESDRIYGDDWFRFLGSARATLATESGCTIFDWDGSLREGVQRELAANPNASYEEIRDKFFPGREGEVAMNQISPKLFEAVACGTALVLYEGGYSGILQPDKHFIPLKKDFSNIDEVLAKVQDVDLLTKMTRSAYADVVGSGRYSYQAFVELFDRSLQPKLPPRVRPAAIQLPMPRCDCLSEIQREQKPSFIRKAWNRLPMGMRDRLRPWIGKEALADRWRRSSQTVKSVLRPIAWGARTVLRIGR